MSFHGKIFCGKVIYFHLHNLMVLEGSVCKENYYQIEWIFYLKLFYSMNFFFEYLPKNNNYSIKTNNTQIISILYIYRII